MVPIAGAYAAVLGVVDEVGVLLLLDLVLRFSEFRIPSLGVPSGISFFPDEFNF
jgi:hypothetical protein